MRIKQRPEFKYFVNSKIERNLSNSPFQFKIPSMSVKEYAASSSPRIATISDYFQLTKPGITLMVLSSMLIGFVLGSSSGIDFITLIHATIGTFLIASGTSAYNQYIERDLDKLMTRTRKRPLPMQRVGTTNAWLFSTMLMLTGLAYLILTVNPVAGLVSASTSILYLAFYTPLKRISFANVFVGSIPGALPPVGGWAAASGTITEPGMWILFGIVFLWQIPHVVSIAWLCDTDYRNAGFKMLPSNDDKGFKSSSTIFLSLLALLPISALLFTLQINSWIYLVGALLAGLVFLFYGVRMMMNRTRETARQLMFASLIYLPAVWAFIVLDLLFL